MISSRMSHTSSPRRSTSFFGGFHGLDDAPLHQLADDEGLEQFERHFLGQTALVHLEFGTDHDHGTAGVVDALAEEVLAETALLAAQHVGQGLERPVALAADGGAPLAVVEERVDGFLQHPLLVAQDDFGGADFEQFLQPVVADDHPAVQVIEIRRKERAEGACGRSPRLFPQTSLQGGDLLLRLQRLGGFLQQPTDDLGAEVQYGGARHFDQVQVRSSDGTYFQS